MLNGLGSYNQVLEMDIEDVIETYAIFYIDSLNMNDKA